MFNVDKKVACRIAERLPILACYCFLFVACSLLAFSYAMSIGRYFPSSQEPWNDPFHQDLVLMLYDAYHCLFGAVVCSFVSLLIPSRYLIRKILLLMFSIIFSVVTFKLTIHLVA